MSAARNRGAYRIGGVHWRSEALADEIDEIDESAWQPLPHGEAWSQIILLDANGPHALLNRSPSIAAVLRWFPGEVLDATLARLSPGGWVKEHRDLSGGAPMGVTRFHIPLVTHREVAFLVDRRPVWMGPGELWVLDTSYPHSLRNASCIQRVHLIVDVRRSAAITAMLPKRDLRDRVHAVHFAGICAAKGLALGWRSPRAMARRVHDAFKLRVLGRSVFRFDQP